jgi:hypothetical protein
MYQCEPPYLYFCTFIALRTEMESALRKGKAGGTLEDFVNLFLMVDGSSMAGSRSRRKKFSQRACEYNYPRFRWMASCHYRLLSVSKPWSGDRDYYIIWLARCIVSER